MHAGVNQNCMTRLVRSPPHSSDKTVPTWGALFPVCCSPFATQYRCNVLPAWPTFQNLQTPAVLTLKRDMLMNPDTFKTDARGGTAAGYVPTARRDPDQCLRASIPSPPHSEMQVTHTQVSPTRSKLVLHVEAAAASTQTTRGALLIERIKLQLRHHNTGASLD